MNNDFAYKRKSLPGLWYVLSGIVLMYFSFKILPDWLPKDSTFPGLPGAIGIGLIAWGIYVNVRDFIDTEFEHRRAVHPYVLAREYVDAVKANNQVILTMDENQQATANAQRIREIVNPAENGPMKYVHSSDGDLPWAFFVPWVAAARPYLPNPTVKVLPPQRDYAVYNEVWYADDGEKYDTRWLVGAWGRFLKNKGYASEHNNQLVFDGEDLLKQNMKVKKWEEILK